MNLEFSTATDSDLKGRALELLAYGVLPFEQWAHVFANPAFRQWPGLRAKAFSVWFPTMVEFLQGQGEISAIRQELSKRGVQTETLFDLTEQLAAAFCAVLLLYSAEDQAFLRDRRLQNVHGRLQINTFEEHVFPTFDRATQALATMRLFASDYRALMTRYYSDLARVSEELIERLVVSREFEALTTLYVGHLKFGEHFMPLIERLGVSAAAGSGADF